MTPPVSPAAVMGFYFFPRGGSAQVARYLCRALAGGRWDPMLFAGSLGTASEYSNADRFFRGVRCQSLDYTPATDRWADGDDPMSAAVPMHASYEDKPGGPDRIFVDLDDAALARQVHSWTQLIAEHTVAAPSVVHLHHLTPIHEAVLALWPAVPVITHLHGTELKMLASVRDGSIPDRPGRFSRTWVERMQRWAGESGRLLVVSAQDRELALELLNVDRERVTMIANGVDTEVFSPRVAQLPNGSRSGGDGSSTILVAGVGAAPKDQSRTTPMTWRRLPMRPGSRYRWSCSLVASCVSSGCRC